MEVSVARPWYEAIKKGSKTIEGRLNKGKFATVTVGDVLIIGNSDNETHDKVVAVVIGIYKYPSFVEYLSKEGLKRTLPGVNTIEQGVAVYRQFYTAELERTHGIVALEIQIVSTPTKSARAKRGSRTRK